MISKFALLLIHIRFGCKVYEVGVYNKTSAFLYYKIFFKQIS